MGLTIIKQFDMRRRRLYHGGKWQDVNMAAFVGATGAFCPGREAQFGIGLMREKEDGKESSNYLFWGSSTSHMLVTAWRAAQIMNMVTDVRESTLFAAFAISSRAPMPKLQSYMEALSQAVPDIAIGDLRMRALSEWHIADEELESMLEICNEPGSNIKPSVQELQEELVEDVIYCTAGVRQVFDRAEREGEKLSYILAESKQPLLAEQSLAELCKWARIRHLCSYADDEPLVQQGLVKVDQRLVYKYYRYGMDQKILCVAKHGQMEWLGHPVVRVRQGDELALYETSYYCGRVLLEVYVLSGKDSGYRTKMSVATLLSMKPRMVGVTFLDGERTSERDRACGYRSTESLWCKLMNRIYRAIST